MFKLTLHDRKGTELKEGDIVAISNTSSMRQGQYFNFFAEVKWLEKEQIIAPFHTFSFHSFEKVDKVPENAILSTEERYKIWYIGNEEATEDEVSEVFNKYLIDWRECETFIEKRTYRINKL